MLKAKARRGQHEAFEKYAALEKGHATARQRRADKSQTPIAKPIAGQDLV